jgi:hypothetical protein
LSPVAAAQRPGGAAALGNTGNKSCEITQKKAQGRRRRFELREKVRLFADRTMGDWHHKSSWEPYREGPDVVWVERPDAEGRLFPRDDRFLACGRRARSAGGGVTMTLDGDTAGLGGLQACGSVWSCPVCAGKIQRERSRELGDLAAWARGEKHTLAMVTLTVRHTKRMPLVSPEVDEETGELVTGVWDAITTGWEAVTSGKAWQSESWDSYEYRIGKWESAYREWSQWSGVGVRPRSPRGGKGYQAAIKKGARDLARTFMPRRRVGDQERYGVLGWARAVEATHGDANGWHVHIHAILVLEAQTMVEGVRRAYAAGHGMFARWKAGVGSIGFESISDSGGLDISVASGAEKRLAEYLAKDGLGDDDAAFIRESVAKQGRDMAQEVTRGAGKFGGRGGRTPFQILEDIDFDANPKKAARDLAVWREWVRGSEGKRQLTWSHNMRKLAGLAAELTDDEIVDADDAGTPVIAFPAETWKVIRPRVIDWLEMCELVGPEATVDALAVYGLKATWIRPEEWWADPGRRYGNALFDVDEL